MNNSCEYYIQRIDETGEGLKPCTNNAKYLLIYYNELEDAVKQFFYCEDCYAELCIKNMDYFNSPKSKVIDLETLIPTYHKDKSAEWLKFAKKEKVKPNTLKLNLDFVEGSFKDQIEIDSKEYEKMPDWMKSE